MKEYTVYEKVITGDMYDYDIHIEEKGKMYINENCIESAVDITTKKDNKVLHLLYVTMTSGKKHYLLKSIEENKE